MKVVKLSTVCMGLMILGMMFTSQSGALDMENVVSIWLFDEGSGELARDSSANGNDAQVIGSLNWIEGPFGKALELNGAGDSVDCGNAESLNVTGEITLTAWVKEAEGSVSQDIIEKWEGQGPYPYVIRIRSTGETYFAAYDGTNGANLLIGDIRDNSWHHIAFTKVPGQTIKGYLDGEFVDEAAISLSDISNPEARLFIGSRSGTGDFYKGAVDEVAIFSTALTGDQIKSIMMAGLMDTVTAVSSSDRLISTWAEIKE